jgi:proton-translocating NADH-quinone oxidoreductase chain N
MNVTTFFGNNLKVVLPELFLLLSVSTLLLVGVQYTTSEKDGYPVVVKPIAWMAAFSSLLGVLLVVNNPFDASLLFNNLLVHDSFTNLVKTVLLLSTASCILVSFDYIKTKKVHAFEFTLLMLFSIVGSMVVVSSYDLLTMYLGIEMSSLCLYALAAFTRRSAFSTEAGLKYFILGAFASGILLFGISLVYGLTGTTNYEDLAKILVGAYESDVMVPNGLTIGVIFIACALLFKATAAPFHMWAPDVYEGAPTIVSTFFAVVPKIAVLGLFVRLFMYSFHDLMDSWQQVILISAALSMVVAAFTALTQRKIKRFLAYSSVGQVGYLLIGLGTGTIEGIQGLLIYTLIYVLMTLNAWTFLLSAEFGHKEGRAIYFTDLIGLAKINPILAITFACTLLSMAGVPPLAGFTAKMYVFFSAMEGSMYFIAVLGVMTSVVGAFYYLRFIKIMYFEKMLVWTSFKSPSREQSIVLGATFLFIIGLFLDPTPLLIMTHKMALTLVL